VFFIIGVAHHVQCAKEGVAESGDQKTFHAVLGDSIERFHPLVVAEELSEYVLSRASEETGRKCESLAKMISELSEVEHRFCDPDSEARAQMDYKDGSQLIKDAPMEDDEGLSNEEINDRGFAIEVSKYWPRREQFWLHQLSDVLDKNLIFVCGDAHIESFRELLKRNDVDSIVVERHIGVTQNDDEFWNRVTSYLRAHPDLTD
jgi:hypothetical protein